MEKICNNDELHKFNDANSDKMTVIKFSGSWCQPCKQLSKVIADIEGDFIDKVAFCECEVDDADESFVEQFNVVNIPMMIFFRNGLLIDKVVGMIGRDKLINKINENLSK